MKMTVETVVLVKEEQLKKSESVKLLVAVKTFDDYSLYPAN